MKYFELQFKIEPNDEAAGDVLAALLAEAGCETFVPTDEGLNAYIQQPCYDEADIRNAADTLTTLLPHCAATFTCTEAPDENWNAIWEAEHHFEPITLPDGQQITIIPRQAFGSGEHATTRLVLQLLATLPLQGKTVIDAGCGTGVLGIAALKLGAAGVFAYDIDEWSVRNALENFALNGLAASSDSPEPSDSPTFPQDNTAIVLEGDARILSHAPQADILLANINRNILLADLPAFVEHLLPGSHLLLSGFLEEDIESLTRRAASLQLSLLSTHADGDWRALAFQKS